VKVEPANGAAALPGEGPTEYSTTPVPCELTTSPTGTIGWTDVLLDG